ncbi:MAG TPA: autotransporter-associated beta strand repeat-containing protein [Kiritimatiellia bacterium]|nr:autotransporter-associated beta strand repeat-containing protein [Kiritimatiellia bacterium]HPS07435.1 autotransporter-associated beta strand repeat-containing protein [Kiritimatiellia bacterium]
MGMLRHDGTRNVGLSIVFLAANLTLAADYTWLGTASGNWNETDANWSGAGTVWTNGSANNATFGAASTKSIVADAITLNNMAFTADGYTIGGGPLGMNGGFTVGAGQSAALTATVSNNVGICEKKGTGTLVLDNGSAGTNRFSTLRVSAGLMHIVGGTHEIYTNNANSINIGFDVNYGSMLVSGGKVRQASGGYSAVRGSLLITNGIVDLSSSREFLNAFNGPGTTTVAGNGLLDVKAFRISQYNVGAGSQNAINVNTGGLIRLTNFYIDTNAFPKGVVNFNGGTVVAKSSVADFLGTGATQWRNGVSARILEGGAVIDTGANAISIKQPLVSGASADGGLTKKGTGAVYLLSTNSYNGPTVIENGTLAFDPQTYTQMVYNTFDPQTHTQTLYNTVTCTDTNGAVGKTGSSMLVLDPGPAAVNTFGSLWCSNGTMVIASGTNLVTRYCGVQNGPGLRVAGGTLLVAGGLLKTTTGAYVNVDGGHLLVTNGVADTLSCGEILNGIGSTYGFTTVGGSGVLLAKRIRISQNSTPATNNVVTVNTGGLLSLESFNIDITATFRQLGTLVLNGGTLQARIDTDNFLGTTATLVGNNNDKWLTNIFVYVREGGAIFDTAGRNISIKQPLYTEAAVDGGLIKRGAGTLTLMNTNTYNGASVVEGGTLKWGRNDVLPPTNTVVAASNGVFDVNGKTQTLAGIGGGGTVTNLAALTVTGTIAPGDADSFGTLTLAGLPASMAGCALAVNVSSNGLCDCLHVRGDLDLSGLALSVADPAQLSKYWSYTVATCTGTQSGAFTSANLPPRWNVKYDAAAKRVYLVYNPGTMILIH